MSKLLDALEALEVRRHRVIDKHIILSEAQWLHLSGHIAELEADNKRLSKRLGVDWRENRKVYDSPL